MGFGQIVKSLFCCGSRTTQRQPHRAPKMASTPKFSPPAAPQNAIKNEQKRSKAVTTTTTTTTTPPKIRLIQPSEPSPQFNQATTPPPRRGRNTDSLDNVYGPRRKPTSSFYSSHQSAASSASSLATNNRPATASQPHDQRRYTPSKPMRKTMRR